MESRKGILLNLRKIREERGWTQEQLSVESNVSAGTISAYEVGRRSWTRKSLKPLADALGVEVTDIIGSEGVATLRTAELLEEILDRVASGYGGQDKEEIEHLIQLLRLKLSSFKK